MDEHLLHQIRNETSIQGARRTLALARVRCLPFEVILGRLRLGLEDENFAELVHTLIELERTADQNVEVAALIADLATEADQLPSGQKDRLDRKIGRLLRCVPNTLARPLVISFLSHPRKLRRQAGLRRLEFQDTDDELCEILLIRYEQTGDDSFLKVLLKHPLRLVVTSPSFLIGQFDEEYWQMRVVQATLEADSDLGVSFAPTHPLPFIWASGRIGDRRLIPLILGCLQSADDKIPLLSIAIWALGKLGAAKELDDLEPLLDELATEHQNRLSTLMANSGCQVPSPTTPTPTSTFQRE